MNKIYKTVFNKKTGKLVVANELKSAMRKGASVISMAVLAVILLQPIEPYAGVANGFYINSIFTGPNGQEILNLNNLDNAMNNNGPTVGDGSIGAGENAVSFGAGEYWKPLGDLSKPQFFINKLQVDRGSGAYDGVQWLRGYLLANHPSSSRNISTPRSLASFISSARLCWLKSKPVFSQLFRRVRRSPVPMFT